MSDTQLVPGSQLPPWDQAPYWDNPKQSNVDVFVGPVQIVGADPTRVGLILSLSAGSSANVGVNTNSSGGNGVLLNTSVPTLEIKHSDYGSLVNAAWFGTGTPGGCTITAIEVLLKKFPGE